MKHKHSYYMDLAIKEAMKAKEMGEIPVGAIIVKDDKIISCAHNTRETQNQALGHAEINAIKTACEELKSWRLSGCTIYVTLEPCPMCMGAILNARIDKVIFGAWDQKAGCCGSVVDFNQLSFNHKCEMLGGICEIDCMDLLVDFFVDLRK